MSTNKRKIGLYSLKIYNRQKLQLKDDQLVQYFNTLIRFISAKNFEEKKEKIESSNKFYYISYHSIISHKGWVYLRGEPIFIIFESAKVGHRPDLIDEVTGIKRENPKTYNEGEDEITHIAFKYKSDEIIFAIEERKAGVTIGQIIKYFNKYILQFPIKKHCDIIYDIIPYDGFLENLEKFKKIQVGTIYINQQDIGSEFLNIAEFGDSVRDTIEVSFKAPARQSIKHMLVSQWYNMTGRERKIDRIRLEGKSLDGSNLRLDTDSLRLTKHIDARILQDTGIVESGNMFDSLNTILKDL